MTKGTPQSDSPKKGSQAWIDSHFSKEGLISPSLLETIEELVRYETLTSKILSPELTTAVFYMLLSIKHKLEQVDSAAQVQTYKTFLEQVRASWVECVESLWRDSGDELSVSITNSLNSD